MDHSVTVVVPGPASNIWHPGRPDPDQNPILDAHRWTVRHRLFLAAGLVVATVAGVVEVAQDRAPGHLAVVDGLCALLAAACGVGMVGLALSLPGVRPRGFAIGGLVVLGGIMSWTWTAHPIVVWAVLGLAGLACAMWSFPWLPEVRSLPRLGTAWLGLSYWFLGIVGAVLAGHLTVAVQRVAYAGVSTLLVLAVVATSRRGRDLSVGVAAAFLCALGALLVVGSGNAFDAMHAVPGNAWGAHMEGRFWGGPGLLYHPNSIAVLAVAVAVRLGVDGRFARWQRAAALGLTGLVLVLVDSRTGLIFFAAVTLVHALLLWRARRGGVPGRLPDSLTRRAALGAALLPCGVFGVALIASGGLEFLYSNRYADGYHVNGAYAADVTSGRLETWHAVVSDFAAAGLAEKLFGDTSNARGVVVRADTGPTPASRPKLTTDNALVGALRRGGLLGVVAFLVGIAILALRALRGAPRRGPPAWFTVAAIGSLATIGTANWLMGGPAGTLWILLVAGEAHLLAGVRR
ncbi:MAG: hypothetical protein V7603_2293 [Micromonosporaceae bacterium]